MTSPVNFRSNSIRSGKTCPLSCLLIWMAHEFSKTEFYRCIALVYGTGMATRLWNYVATFSNLPGDRLSEIYKKLRPEAQADYVGASSQDVNHGGAAGPSGREDHTHLTSSRKRTQNASSAHTAVPSQGETEAWKRRQRDSNHLGGPHGGTLTAADRRKWDGRPGSSEGRENRAGDPRKVAPGLGVNGSGWSHDRERGERVPWGHEGRGDWNRRDVDRPQIGHPRSVPVYPSAAPHAQAFTP